MDLKKQSNGMNAIGTELKDSYVILSKTFEDKRGFFMESFNLEQFHRIVGYDVEFVQDNHSKSKKGVLRGLHYQYDPPMGKLVRVIAGSGFDVVVDIRSDSSTFGQHQSFFLSEENNRMVWVPAGFAHGFIALENNTHLCYKTDALYNSNTEGSIYPLDSELNIDWGIDIQLILLSDKDREAQSFGSYKKDTRF